VAFIPNIPSSLGAISEFDKATAGALLAAVSASALADTPLIHVLPCNAQIAHEDELFPSRSIPDQRQEMSVLAKSFSAVLLALPFSLSAFSDPYRPTSPTGRCRHCHSLASKPLTKPKRPLSCSGNRVC
jgi:hypothetical protein